MAAARRVLGTTLAVFLLAGCGGSDDDGARSARVVGTFVGAVTGSDAYVAVVAGTQNVVAYVCDGEQGIAQLFSGRRSEDRFEVRAGGARITAELSERAAVGRVAIAGATPRRFAAKPAKGRAGFYRRVLERDRREVRLGWAVRGDGSQRGASTTPGNVGPAPSLRVSSGTFVLSGRTLTASRIDSTSLDASGQLGFGAFRG
jgi:hypothetical protein